MAQTPPDGLLKQFLSTPPDDQEALVEQVLAGIDKEPEALALRQRWRRDGTLLWVDIWLAWRSIVARPDVSELEKLEALNSLEDIAAGIGAFRRAPRWPLLQRFAWAALFLGLSARPSADELNALRARVIAEVGRAGGRKGTVTRRTKQAAWTEHAAKLAKQAYSHNSKATDAEIARYIIANWRLPNVTRPKSNKTFEAHVAKLRACGQLPQRSGSFPK
jgi:hypothetical protein